MKNVETFILLLIGFMAMTVGADAEISQWRDRQNVNSPYMHSYGQSLPPIGHVGFCRRNPDECSNPSGHSERIKLTAKRERELRDVNDLVNQTVLPTSDLELYGQLEHWSYPASKGDCEDYVLLKRRLLMKRSWPASALLITVVRDQHNEGHAILTVRTDEGDVILDNKKKNMMVWNHSGYTFIKRQSHRNPKIWVSLTPPEVAQAAPLSGTKAR